MAAAQGVGVEELLELILQNLFAQARRLELLIPYTEGGLLSQLTQAGTVLEQDYRADGTYLCVEVIPSDANRALLAKAEAFTK